MNATVSSMYSRKAMDIAKRLGLDMARPNLDVFAETLLSLGHDDRNILAVTSDSRGSGKLVPFGKALPDQLIEVGIAEQNLVGVSAGLASTGKNVFAVSPACFLTTRSLEQIKNDVCYSDNPVKLIGISAGVSYGALGSTHHSTHDLAALRAINNIDIVVPADNYETRETILASAHRSRPTYIRLGKAPMYDLHCSNASQFEIGRARMLCEGDDVAFIATGETVIHALLAAQYLESQGVSAGVFSMHTVKPLDVETLISIVQRCKALVTVEEHATLGGLGEACAAVLLQAGANLPFRIIAIPDEYTVTGNQSDIFHHYGISMEGLSRTALNLIGELRTC